MRLNAMRIRQHGNAELKSRRPTWRCEGINRGVEAKAGFDGQGICASEESASRQATQPFQKRTS